MRFDSVKELKGEAFRRLTGIQRDAFEEMAALFAAKCKQKAAGGHRHAQTLQDRRRPLQEPPTPLRPALLPHRRHLQQGAKSNMTVMQEVKYFKTDIEPLLDHPLVEFIGEIAEAQKCAFLVGSISEESAALLARGMWCGVGQERLCLDGSRQRSGASCAG